MNFKFDWQSNEHCPFKWKMIHPATRIDPSGRTPPSAEDPNPTSIHRFFHRFIQIFVIIQQSSGWIVGMIIMAIVMGGSDGADAADVAPSGPGPAHQFRLRCLAPSSSNVTRLNPSFRDPSDPVGVAGSVASSRAAIPIRIKPVTSAGRRSQRNRQPWRPSTLPHRHQMEPDGTGWNRMDSIRRCGGCNAEGGGGH